MNLSDCIIKRLTQKSGWYLHSNVAHIYLDPQRLVLLICKNGYQLVLQSINCC